MENQISDLNNKLLLLKETNSALEKQIGRLGAEKSLLEQDLDKAKQDINKKMLENETLNNNIAELKKNLNGKENEVLDLIKDIDGLKASKRKLELDSQELSGLKDSSNAQIHQFNSRISDLNLSSESMKNTINQLSGILAKKRPRFTTVKTKRPL